MLYPQNNPFRQALDLSGFWDLTFDPLDAGRDAGYSDGFAGGRPAAVPGSWNEQFADGRDYLGPAWYQTRFHLPFGWGLAGRRAYLRFNSVNYLAEVWLNGLRLGQHEGGHLPFTFELPAHLLRGEGNLLVVRVDGSLAPDRVPPGAVPADGRDGFASQVQNLPPASFDFFPYCGIHRPVLLYTAPDGALADLTFTSRLEGEAARLRVAIHTGGQTPAGYGPNTVTARVTLQGHGAELREEVRLDTTDPAGTTAELTLDQPALWEPGAPNLYTLTVTLLRERIPYDSYSLPVGIREVQVQGDRLLLNGRPVTLKGFGRHEDFAVVGRGLFPAGIVKDYALMEWVGANSFRTTHYPYSEQMMDLADRLGFLVIDETPAVGLFFAEAGLERRLELCQQYVRELVDRDKNRPSVILWSLANEPHSNRPAAAGFFRSLFDLVKTLDPTRPATVVSYIGLEEPAFAFCDVLALNRYSGWYTESGRIEDGAMALSAELDALHARYPRPLLLTEFGADASAGHHAQPPEMFSEEYQAAFLEAYLRVLRSKPFVVGAHVWNLCDFKTSQGVIRVNSMNLKGVFTRDRRPKLAAHRLRALWQEARGEEPSTE
jgi:beta-glucuronidase